MTKKKATKKVTLAAGERRWIAAKQIENMLHQLEALRTGLELARARVEQLVRVDRMAWVTIEGFVSEPLSDEPLSSLERSRRLIAPKPVQRVRAYGWTKGAQLPHADSRVTVRFEPVRPFRLERVLVHGAGAITAVRVGREDVGLGVDCKGLSLFDISKVCELGSCIQVDIEMVAL